MKHGVVKPSEPTGQTSRTLLALFSNRWWWLYCLVLLTAFVLKLFFTKGHTYSFDGANHTAEAKMVYECLSEGEFPMWSNRWYAGFPLMQFPPPPLPLSDGLAQFPG